MSELAVHQTPADRFRVRRLASLVGWVAREALPVLVVSICAIEVLTTFRFELGQDGWLTFLGGRIVAHGLPHHDALVAWAHGGSWVDQQWLAQLLFYGAFSAGGVKLALFLNAALTTGAFAGAVAAGRRRGGAPARVAVVAVLCLPVVVFGWPLRAQSFAYPLFVAVLWLLARDSANPSRRVFLVFPVLVLWANLHGSVVLGGLLVALRGITFAVREMRAGKVWLARSAVLVGGPALLLFASPYGFDLAGYYHRLLFNQSLTTYIVEWQPTSPKPITVPFFVMAFAAIWLLGRSRSLTVFERLALVLTIVAALSSVRHIAWFGLTAIVLLPRALEEIWTTRPARTSRVTVLAGTAALVAALVVGAVVAAKPLSWLHRDWSPNASAAVARATSADPSLQVVSSLRYADWLLFTRPELAGRLVFDARLELLSRAHVKQVVQIANAIGETWKRAGANARLFVVDRESEKDLERVLLSERGVRTVYRDGQVIALLRSGSS